MNDKVRTDVMVDMETLSTQENAVALSIGLVEFNRRDPSVPTEEHYYVFGKDEFVKEQVSLGRHVDPDTKIWWSNQTEEAQQIFYQSNIESIKDMLEDITFYIEMMDVKPLVWGNGSDFDNVILNTLFRSYGMDTPWRFWNNRCFRTFKGEHGHLVDMPNRLGTHHNALDDALFQVDVLQRIYTELQKSNLKKSKNG